jgi:hypothetical protein
MSPKSAIVRIFSAPKNGYPLGGGVLISAEQVLTCDHVVDDALTDGRVYLDFPILSPGRKLAFRVLRRYPVNEFIFPGVPDDLAVLQLMPEESLPEGAAPSRFLHESDEAFQDRPVRIIGFPEGSDHGEWIEGELKGLNASGLVQIDHGLTSRTVAPGFSGSAVWTKAEDRVAGVVVGRTERDGKRSAHIVPVRILLKACQPTRDRTRTKSGKPIDERECDRTLEYAKFSERYEHFSRKFPGCPQFFILPGEIGDGHDSFISRISDYQLKSKTYTPHLVSCPWDVDGDDPALLRRILMGGLYNAFDCKLSGGEGHFEEICHRLHLKAHKMVIITHDIHASHWNRRLPDLIRWYIGKYRSELKNRENIPQFLVFFNIKYPQSIALTVLNRCYWRWVRRRMIRQSLTRLHAEMDGQCPCHLFNDLRPIIKKDVENWLNQQLGDRMSEKEKIKRAEKLFKKRGERCMADIEDALMSIRLDIQRKQAGFDN